MHALLFDGSIVFAVLFIVQTWLLAKKHRSGWALSIFNLLLAVPYDILTSQPGYVLSSLISLVISMQAWRRWHQ